MTDLERFFERLVRNLVAIDPARVTSPIPVPEIKQEILPYRTSRRSLALETSEEYEELLVRLVSEEGKLVKTEPRDVADWCHRQMSSLSPDLSGIPGQAGATVQINPDALARIMGPEAVAGLAQGATGEMPTDGLPLPPQACPHCEVPLPPGRAINFCPSCGRSLTLIPCDNCGADLQPGWRFCVTCGQETIDAAQQSVS